MFLSVPLGSSPVSLGSSRFLFCFSRFLSCSSWFLSVPLLFFMVPLGSSPVLHGSSRFLSCSSRFLSCSSRFLSVAHGSPLGSSRFSSPSPGWTSSTTSSNTCWAGTSRTPWGAPSTAGPPSAPSSRRVARTPTHLEHNTALCSCRGDEDTWETS